MAVTIPGAGPRGPLARQNSHFWDESNVIRRTLVIEDAAASLLVIPVDTIDAAEYFVALRASAQARGGTDTVTVALDDDGTEVATLNVDNTANVWAEDIAPATAPGLMAAGSKLTIDLTNASTNDLNYLVIVILTRPAIGKERLGA